MSDQLFGRAVRVIVANPDTGLGPEITGLRVQLKVKKSLKKEPNTCELSVFNLSPATRANMQKRGARVIVEAGYTDTLSQIFSGDARVIDHIHDGANWITKVQCGDGERAYQFSRITESFRPGTKVADVIQGVIQATGLDGTKAIQTVKALVSEQFIKGYAANGKASAELDRLLRGRGLEWSIQDGQIQVLQKGATTQETAVLVSPDSGLVGSPEHGTPSPDEKKDKANTLKVKSLMNPQIRPGRIIAIQANGIRGQFRVLTVEHSGDTHGGEWYSVVECTPES
jgi:hypothetical protein